MLSYYNEELTRNTSQGVQNIVSDVRLLKGEITESWEEGDLQYATAFMRWSAIDQVVRLGQPEQVVSGDPRTPSEQEEMWTFVRRRGGNWLLSAVQQVEGPFPRRSLAAAAMQPERRRVVGLQGDPRQRQDRLVVGKFDPHIPQQSRQDQHRLGQRELRADAGAWPGAERQIGKPRRRRGPR